VTLILIALSSIHSVLYRVDSDSKPKTNKIRPGTRVQTNSNETILVRLVNSKLDRVIQLNLNSKLDRMNDISNKV